MYAKTASIGILTRGMACLVITLLIPNPAAAISFTSFDARSMAMGGAGVASARSYNALLFNPALLARRPTDEPRANSRPYAGARLIDRDDFLDSLDAFKEHDNNDRLRAEFRKFQQHVDAGIEDIADARAALAEARKITATARALLQDYASLSDKPLRVSASAGITLGYTGNGYAMGALLRRSEMGGTEVRLDGRDTAAVTDVLDTVDALDESVESYLDGNQLPLAVTLLNLLRNNIHIPTEQDLASTLTFQGAVVTETAVAYTPLSTETDRWRWGATFKSLEFETVEYSQRVADAEAVDFSDDAHRLRYRDFNIDFGLTRQIGHYWRFGAVVRNAIPYDYRTAGNNTVSLRPLVRAGTAYEPRCCTLAADLDITTNDPLGFDPEKRYLAVGAEWRVWRNTALRSGYRYNTVSGSGLYSLGVGLGPYHTHLDVGLAVKGDELGASLQFAAYF